MAVTKMAKVTIISDNAQQAAVLQTLQGLQNVEVRDLLKTTENNAWVQDYFSGSLDQQMETRASDLEQLQLQIAECVQFIEHYGSFKKQKGAYLKRQIISLQEMEAGFDEGQLRSDLNEILTLKRRKSKNDAKQAALLTEEDWLTGWQYLDVNPQDVKSAFTQFLMVSVSSNAGGDFLAELAGLDLVHAEAVFQDEKEWLVSLVYPKQLADQVQQALNQYSVQVEAYPYEQEPKAVLTTVKTRLATVSAEAAELAQAIGKKRNEIKRLQWTEEVVLALKERETAKNQLIQARYLFVLQGWISVDEQGIFLEELRRQLGENAVYTAFETPSDYEVAEEVPTKLKNHPLVRPFEMLTEMYALPKYDEVDPTPWMMPFYFVFFGMMVADMGYGLLMLVGTVLAQRLFVLPRGMGRFVTFFQILSVPSILWGAIYGSFFGLATPFEPLLSTQDDVIQILLLSVAFGFIQILVGLFVAAKEHMRRKEYLDAVGNGFAWQGILIGIAVAVVGNMLLDSSTLTTIGAAVAIVSAACVIVVPIIQSDSKVTGAAVGAYNLYGLTSYIGDLVSYTRLMALGISGGSIAAAFNLLVAFMPPVARYTAGIVLIVALHALNIFLTLLSAYVHGARLQYVEFFGKFYTGGGRVFKPLKTAEKYVNIEREK